MRTLILLIVLFCIVSYTQAIIQDTCTFATEVHALPSTLHGMWRENRARLVQLSAPSLTSPALIFLTGDKQLSRYSFRQDSNFLYVSGANMPDYFISINVSTQFTTLFVPAPSSDYPVWYGHVYTKEQLQIMYDVDQVLYTSEMTNFVNSLRLSTTVYTINSSVALPTSLSKLSINSRTLSTFMTNARATKSEKEIALLVLVNKISSNAHINAMRFVASRMNTTTHAATRRFPSPTNPHATIQTPLFGSMASHSSELHVPLDEVARESFKRLDHINFYPFPDPYERPKSNSPRPVLFEYEIESLFEFSCGLCGALQQSYLPIVGAGNNGAILHYIANNQEVVDGDILLIDAGGEYWGYGSDITATYPVDGIFTDDQRLIYTMVLDVQTEVLKAVKGGVTWTTLNAIARESITRSLLNEGFIQGDFSVLMSQRVYDIFYPHGIGHSLGLDVHDSQTTTIYPNQVITVEPGIYFNGYLLDEAKRGSRAKYILWDQVDRFRGTGGVRIEDDFVVTAMGSMKITQVPRSIADIEKLMRNEML